MMKQTKKLRLGELQVESFVTNINQENKTLEIVGASGVGNRWCTTTFYTENPEACATVAGCDTVEYTCGGGTTEQPTVAEAHTCGRDCL